MTFLKSDDWSQDCIACGVVQQILMVSRGSRIAARLVRLAAAALVASALGPRPAMAMPMTWQFSGTTDAPFGDLATLFPQGTAVEFTLTYDTDWAATPGVVETYAFGGSTPTSQFGYKVRVGQHEYEWSQRGIVYLYVRPDGFSMDTSLSEVTMAGDPVGTTPRWFPVAFDVDIALPLASGGLPSSFPTTLTNSSFTFFLRPNEPSCAGCGADAWVNGSLNTASKIPTPSTLLLTGIGLAGFAAWRRRRGQA
jgi:hypothetical protein